MKNIALAGVLGALLLCPSLSAQDWPSWRGPHYDGSTEVTGLPRTFSRTENVRWAAALPGPGASTPIVVGTSVFLSAVDEEEGELLAICVERDSGELRWVRPSGSGYRPGGAGSATRRHERSNYASPSAATDGERVVFLFGNGDLVAYDFAGERVWARNLQEDYGDFAFQWTFSASPTIVGSRLFVAVLQRDEPVDGVGKDGAESTLLALEVATGETLYRRVRPSDARRESLESYATVIPGRSEGREELFVVGGDVITGHDPATGAELWRWGTWNPGHREEWWRVVPSPVVGAGVALACGPKGAPVCAVRLGGEGLLGDDRLAWKSGGRRDPVTTDVPTPLFFDGDFFVLSDLREALTRVDAATGVHEWSIGLPGEFKWRASPTGADGRVWLLDHGGNVVVVDAKTGEVLHRAALGEEDDDLIRSSIAVADRSLFVRTNTTLFRIGEENASDDREAALERVSLPAIDLDGEVARQTVVDREAGQYLGHPSTCLLEDGRTILCVYPKGHGRGAIVYKRSSDGGLTWSERLPTPASWAASQEVPTIHRVVDAAGVRRLILWSGLYPARLATSEDDGATWSELLPAGDWGGIVVMGFVEALRTGPGHYLAMFHDDGRFLRADSKPRDPRVMTLYRTTSEDGGLTWSEPEEVFASSEIHLCEPGCIRSPDGRRLAVLLRENARRRNSYMILSDDEGRTWSAPRELPLALTGDRHTGKYAPDGRLLISFRCISPEEKRDERPFEGDWVGWVGAWEDLVQGREGQYVVRFKDNVKGYDTTYPGVEVLPDGTFVLTTYGHWDAGEEPYVLSVRVRLEELDGRAR